MTTETANTRIRVLLADDHPMLREGVAAVIQLQADMELVGEAENGADAVECFRRLRPDVTLMDLQMPGLNGVEAIKGIRAEFPKARIVVLTTYAGDAQALRALKAGAAGYLLKSSLRKELLETIRDVHLGRRHLQAEVANEIAVHAVDETLTEREVRVLQLIATGHANKQVAWELGVSEETIKSHLKNIFEKLDVADRTHAVAIAAKRGIIEL